MASAQSAVNVPTAPAPPPPPPAPPASRSLPVGSAGRSGRASLITGAPPDGVPEDADLAADTFAEEPNLEEVGENTEELSDVTDEEDARMGGKTTKHSFATWYKQIQPLVRNKRVRCFSCLNLILFLVNVALLIALLVLIVYMAVSYSEANKYRRFDKPCLFRWAAWGPCSKTCRDPNDAQPPFRTRRVDADSVVQARGKYERTAKCPYNLANIVDHAPCNTYLCPVDITNLSWAGPFFQDPGAAEKTCYKIRNIPKGDRLIRINNGELNLTKLVNCTTHEDLPPS